MIQIKYTNENIDLFRRFLTPIAIKDYDNFNNLFAKYQNNIKEFFEREMNLHINVYFQKVNTLKVFYYIIEYGDNSVEISDDIEETNMFNYNDALNRAIKYLLTNLTHN